MWHGDIRHDYSKVLPRVVEGFLIVVITMCPAWAGNRQRMDEKYLRKKISDFHSVRVIINRRMQSERTPNSYQESVFGEEEQKTERNGGQDQKRRIRSK